MTRITDVAREALEHDSKRTQGIWHNADCIQPRLVLYAVPADKAAARTVTDADALNLGNSYCDADGQARANMKAICHAVNNLRALAETVLAWAPIVEAAKEWAAAAPGSPKWAAKSWRLREALSALSKEPGDDAG